MRSTSELFDSLAHQGPKLFATQVRLLSLASKTKIAYLFFNLLLSKLKKYVLFRIEARDWVGFGKLHFRIVIILCARFDQTWTFVLVFILSDTHLSCRHEFLILQLSYQRSIARVAGIDCVVSEISFTTVAGASLIEPIRDFLKVEILFLA